MEVMFIVVALVVAVVTLWDAVRDPRKVRIGVGIVIAVALTLTQLFGQTVTALENMDDTAQRASVFILAAALVTLLGIVAFGAMLVFNGLEVLRRERHSLANALSLIIGVLILVYVVITVVTVFSSNVQTFLLMVLVGFPTGYLGLGLVAYVVWASAYTAWMRRRGIPVAAVIVLGAGLSGGRTVTPLLAARVDAAIDWIRTRPAPEGTAPWLVCSGGQGPDEQVSEAQAMAEYAESRGGAARTHPPGGSLPEHAGEHPVLPTPPRHARLCRPGRGGDQFLPCVPRRTAHARRADARVRDRRAHCALLLAVGDDPRVPGCAPRSPDTQRCSPGSVMRAARTLGTHRTEHPGVTGAPGTRASEPRGDRGDRLVS